MRFPDKLTPGPSPITRDRFTFAPDMSRCSTRSQGRWNGRRTSAGRCRVHRAGLASTRRRRA